MEQIVSTGIIDSYFAKLKSHLSIDVAIVGGGPSGIVAAYYLAKSGKKVALFDRKLAPGGGISESRPVVRSVDIAAELDFKKSSVSVAMKKLREHNHITVTPEGFIYLTESGKEIADRIYERHKLLSSWLERLGVDPEIAVADACRIEHVISAESFEAIKGHIS